MLIYLIRNKINNKVYIGKHKGTDLLCRWRDHQDEAQKGSKKHPFYHAIRKYGSGAFEVVCLSSFAASLDDLNQQEIHFITKYQATDWNFGYNICRGGEGFTGRHSKESRAKMSVARKGQLPWNTGKILTEKQKINFKGRPVWNKGKSHSEETRAKLRKARLKQSDPRLGKPHSEETKIKLRAANLGKHSSPATELRPGHVNSKETREKISNTMKRKGIKPPNRKGQIPWNKKIKNF